MRAPMSGMSALVAAESGRISRRASVGQARAMVRARFGEAVDLNPSRTLRLLRADREPVLPQPLPLPARDGDGRGRRVLRLIG